MIILQSPTFKKLAKKLHKNQKIELDTAVKQIAANPVIGQVKKGDLNRVRVYKFKMAKQLTLLGYSISLDEAQLILLAFGSHENFYRDLKKRF